MIKRFIAYFSRVTPLAMAKASLAEHEKELLVAREHVSFYTHEVNYRLERISDLQATVKQYEQNDQAEVPTAVQRQRNSRRAPLAAAA